MKKSGSITVFTSLFLAVFLLVFQVLLQSVQIGGGRVQAETGVEEGLYSVFAGYDRELLERYHVFMVDGSYGTGVWKPECMYQTVKKCMEESCRPDGAISGVRGENLWKCSSVSGAITAYTLMSDEHGRGYRAQAVDYMKETLGIQGIQLLMKKYEQQKDIFEQQEKRGSDIDVKQSMDSYEKARKEAGQNQGQDPDNTGQQPAVVQVPADFVNPLDVIRQLQKKSILALVVPAGKELSQKGLPKEKRLSRREKQTGMGIPFYGAQEDTVLTRGIFQSYMMQHLTDYTSMEHATDPLRYQLEYVIGGKNTDQENLKAVVYRLLAAREAANMMYLLQDPTRQAEIHEMALVICAAIGFPALEGIVSLALQAAWAFGESLLDVRQLLTGGKVPLVKTGDTWMVSLQAICKNKRRVFLCFFRKTRGKKQQIPAVLTVEAALVIPLFLLGICTLLGIMDLYRVQVLVKTSLHQSAQELGMYASVESGDSGVNTPTGVLSSGVCSAYAKAHLPELGDGVAVSLIGSRYENHKIQLKATVLYQLPFSILPVSKLKVTNSSVVHAWTGYDPKNTDNEGTDGGEMVYVTEYESVYHTSESCTHLDLSVHRGTKTQVEQKRNEYGGKYHACERCGGDSALVYYTEKGDCYHSQASCSGLKRTVRLVKKSEIQAYIQCERCRENAG